MAPLSVGSLFTGVGGFDLAAERAGMRVAWQVEKDPACLTLLAHRFPGVPRHDDVASVHAGAACPLRVEQSASPIITAADRARWRASAAGLRDAACASCLAGVDVLVGGFPCQDISVAGRRAGLAGERSGLWWEFRRLIAEFAPLWVVIENVPGLLSSNSGRDMAAILGALGELGYGFAYRVLDAQHFGVPQRRRRVFIVGHRGTPYGAPASVLLESESLRWHPEAGAAPRSGVARSLTGSTGGASAKEQQDSFVGDDGSVLNPLDDDAVVGTLESGDNRTGGTRPRGTTVDTADSLLVSEDVAYALGAAQGSRFGSGRNNQDTFVEQLLPDVAMALNAERDGYNDGSDQTYIPVAHALTAIEGGPTTEDGTGRGVPLIVSMRGREAGNVPEVDPDGVVPAIRQGDGGSGNPMLVAAFAIEPESGQGADLVAHAVEVAAPLDATEGASSDRGTRLVVGVAENQRGEVLETDYAHQLSVGGGKPGQGYPAILEAEPLAIRTAQTSANGHGLSRGAAHTLDGAGQAIDAPSGVRRLTPLECERLQGFPDAWTAIAGASDSTRYRQLGNAVAVPVVAWIARRMVAVEARLRTP